MILFAHLYGLRGQAPRVLLSSVLGLALGIASGMALPTSLVWAQEQQQPKASVLRAADGSKDGLSWQELTPAQQLALQPLQSRWSSLRLDRQQKWLDVAQRFARLTARDQARVHERMASWSQLTPEEHGQARLNFQEAKQLSNEDRQDKWESYQSLSDDEKRVLAQRHREQLQGLPRAGRLSRQQDVDEPARTTHKFNLTPNPSYAPAPQPVGAALLRAAPGATTSLMSRRPRPPEHQQTGLPKIQSSAEFVDPLTLLPQRGPQGAAVARAASSVQKTIQR